MKQVATALLLICELSLAVPRLPEGPQAKLVRVTADGHLSWTVKCSIGIAADVKTRCILSKHQDGIALDQREIALERIEKVLSQFLLRSRNRETASATSATDRKLLEWNVSNGSQASTGILRHTHGAQSPNKTAVLALEHALDWELTRARLKR